MNFSQNIHGIMSITVGPTEDQYPDDRRPYSTRTIVIETDGGPITIHLYADGPTPLAFVDED